MTRAEQTMRRLNPNMDIAREGSYTVGVEDCDDTDEGLYRVAYIATPDGRHAIAFCLDNAWDDDPYDYDTSHVRNDGLLCLCENHTDVVEQSPINVETAIKRARYWCVGFSQLMETGQFPDP